jgi:DNA-binding MarR family transcriptional regulator
MASKDEIDLQELQALSDFRYNIRRFMRASEEILREQGLKPQQYQLLLHLKAMPDGVPRTIGQMAERLQLQHHSTVELADRLAVRGLVRRKRAGEDRRHVLLELTPKGDKVLAQMAALHRDELRNTGTALVGALKKILSATQK